MLGADAGTMVVEPVILQPRKPAPAFIVDAAPRRRGQLANHGQWRSSVLLDISSVYDVDGVDTVPHRPTARAEYRGPGRPQAATADRARTDS